MSWDVRRFGARGDGITNDSAAINTAIEAAARAGGGAVEFSSGTYRCLNIRGRNRVSLIGHGATLVKHGGGRSTHVLELAGGLGHSAALKADVAPGAGRLETASAGAFSPGDQILIRDATFACGNLGRNQELNRVAEVSRDGLELANPTLDAYHAGPGGAEVVRLAPVGNLTIEGLTFVVPDGRGALMGGAVHGELTSHVTLRGCTAIGPDDNAGFQFEQSAWIVIDGCNVRDGQNCGPLGRGNGIVIGESSHNCIVTHCRTENVSENAFENNTRHSAFLDNVDLGSHDDSFNTHGSACRHIQIRGNLCVGGRKAGITVGFADHTAGDLDVIVADNTIADPGTHGISVAAPWSKANNDIVVRGNAIWRPSRAAPGSCAICLVGSRHVTVVGNAIVGGGPNPAHGVLAADCANVIIRGNSLRDFRGGYGISYTGCETVTIAGNTLAEIASYNVFAAPPAPSGAVVIQGNRADDSMLSVQPDDVRLGNVWGDVAEA